MAQVGRPPKVRVSFDPLLKLTFCPSIIKLAEYMGWSDYARMRRLQRWHRDGGIPVDWMDEVATAAGFHPRELWPAAWSEFIEGDDCD